MHDSVRLDHCWLLWHSPNTDLCGPGTCRRPIMCPCIQPGCVETTDSWNLWISTHAGEDEYLGSSQMVFCKYFLESRTCEILSVVSPVPCTPAAFWFPGFPPPSFQMYSSLFWSRLIKTPLHSHWCRQTLCQSFNERAAREWLTGCLQ